MSNPTSGFLDNYNLRYNWGTAQLEMNTGGETWVAVPESAGTITLPSGQLLVGNGSNVATAVTMSGDATLANTGALTIANSAITNAKVSASAAIAYSKLNLASSILGTDINASAAIPFSTLAALTSAHILVGNGSNVATNVALSGDATLSNAGALTLATVNGNVGSFTSANITVDAKGRITAAASGGGGSSLPNSVSQNITQTGAINSITTYTSLGFSLAITPVSSSNHVLVTGWISLRVLTAGAKTTIGIRIKRNGSVVMTNDNYIVVAAGLDSNWPAALQFLDAPASTSATTYTVEASLISGAGAELDFNNFTSSANSTVTVTEVP